jgi:diguanylate cyclase (GGDEF)-like protein
VTSPADDGKSTGAGSPVSSPRLPRSASSPLALRVYLGAVLVAGLAATAIAVRTGADTLADHLSWSLELLALLAVLGEFVTLRVHRRGAEGEITFSTAFSFAVLLAGGVLAGLITLVIAGLAADLHARKPALRAAFNAAQYAVAMTAAGAVLALLSDVPHAHGTAISPHDLPAIAAAAATLVIINSLLVGLVVALSQGWAVVAYVRADFWFGAASAAMPLVLAPVAVVAGEWSAILLPALAVPLFAVHQASRHAMELEYRSRHDALTDLPNRTLLDVQLDHELRRGHRLALLLLDLDGLREINDTLGHGCGDRVLVEVAERLRAAVGTAMIARFGGDEFAVLLTGTDAEAPLRAGRRLQSAVDAPMAVEGVTLRVEVSVGVAIAPQHGRDRGTLLRRADIAMHVAKRQKTGVEAYQPEQERTSPARLSLAAELGRAIEQGELVVHYQPIAELATGRVVAVEALVRWQHPEQGLLMPGAFVPLAENTGLMGPMTRLVLDRALTQLRAWDHEGLVLDVAVNLSARSLLDRGLPERVRGQLAAHDLPPRRLDLEITESMVAADPQRAREVLEGLRAVGVGLTIDDFGTGYSSLTNVRELPISQLKIDQSFIRSMATSRPDAVIVRSTIELARGLGLRTVAEGVETGELWQALLARGGDLAQGYWLAAPMPAAELTAWLHERLRTHPFRRSAEC